MKIYSPEEVESLDLDATISRCFAHVERIELDARMTVREYRQWQERGCENPLSAECQELYRLQKVVANSGPTNGDGSFRIAVPYIGV